MPSNRRSVYRCCDCGTDYPKWTGRCESCGAWNTLAEEIVSRRPGSLAASKGRGNVPEAVRLGVCLSTSDVSNANSDHLNQTRNGVA